MRLAPADITAIIVNYNAAPLALDAALSALGDGARRAIIVDNASTDDSIDFFRAAADGEAAALCQSPSEQLRGHDVRFDADARLTVGGEGDAAVRLLLIVSPDNRGFAAGCNQGLRFWRDRAPTGAGLLLNPDALVARGALAAFCDRLGDPAVGLCGASVVDFAAPHALQAAGGARLTEFFHQGRNMAEGRPLEGAPDRDSVEAAMTYPLGAAMAFRADYLDVAGFLDERYFLYYEEADWTLAAGDARKPGWAPGAVIYHRYGASSGSLHRRAGAASARSPLSDYHMARSRLIFAKKWRPRTNATNRAAIAAQAAMRYWRGRRENARAVLDALAG